MSFSEITKKFAKSLGNIFSSQDKQGKSAALRPRRLHMDVLEERQLLAVNTMAPFEFTLTPPVANSSPTMSSNRFYINGNSTYLGADYTESVWGSNYMAANNQGDTIITWAQNDYVYRMNPDGSYVTDQDGNKILATDKFNNPYNDYNIYARYLTDQVERLTLPEDLLTDNVAKTDGTFKLIYAPYEVQRLTISTVTAPTYIAGTGDNVKIRFYIGGADTNGDGSPNFLPVEFDETYSPERNATEIQRALNQMGGIYANATVVAESTKEFLITFNYQAGYNIPELETKDLVVDSGTYVGLLTSTVSEPIVISTTDSYGNDQGIRVDPTDPLKTAERIQLAFEQHNTEYYVYPRVENYTKNARSTETDVAPSTKMFTLPEVKVAVVNGNTFDITFVNGGGLSDHEIVLVSAVDEFGNEYVGSSDDYSIDTIKKSSDVFRVNAPEGNDPDTGVPLVTNQINPSVAMDADGDFVITWESEVQGSGMNTITDIYARQFSPQAFLNENKISFYSDGYTERRVLPDGANSPVQGVRPVGDQFRVNNFSNNQLTDPSVGMDRDGNFVITWSSIYQFSGAGSGMYAKRYDRYGSALSDAFSVSWEDTDYPIMHSTVAISDDGYLAVAWIHNTDTNYQNVWTIGELRVSVFAPGSSTPLEGWDKRSITGGAYNPSLDFNPQNDLLITYTDHHPYGSLKGPNGMEGADVLAEVYSLTEDPDSGNRTYSQTREPFRIHSIGGWYNGNTYADAYWRSNQYNGIGKFDADGDIVFIYQGYGPDATYSASSVPGGYIEVPGSYFTPYLNETKNSDLLKFFDPTQPGMYFYAPTSDIDTAIRDYLVSAIRNNASADEVARLNAVLEKVLGQMRGGGNDIFTTRINTGDWKNTPVDIGNAKVIASSSDANVTSTRDGVNSRYYVLVPDYATNVISGGSITFSLYTDYSTTASYNVPFTITNNVFNAGNYRNAIYQAFNSINGNGAYTANGLTGILAPAFAGNYLSIPAAEVNYYTPGTYENIYGGTIWDVLPDPAMAGVAINGYHVYEIIFTGTAHDTTIYMSYGSGTTVNRRDIQGNYSGDLPYPLSYAHTGFAGTEQTTPGLAVQPSGSYVASWFTNITTTNGTVVDRKINYRYFQEDSDIVGPRVTDVILPNGQYVANNSTVSYSLENIVVTFDEQLLANGAKGLNSVLNPNNWVLMKDGVAMNGIIKEISFGMNKAMDLIDPNSDLADTLLSHGSNKWEAVITFTEPLTTGSYQLVATNKLTDVSGVTSERGVIVYGAGNALGSNGTNRTGENFSRVFRIDAIDGTLGFGDTTGTVYDDKLVSDTSGEHYTRPAYDADTPSNPTSVASDDQGNFVTVWTEEGVGIRAKIYHQVFEDRGNGRESFITVLHEFHVTTNPTATYASVAMDVDGDFVVTWMQDDANGSNIYARAYYANGTPRTATFLVNSHSNGVHKYPDVAMDQDGGFVITWESENQAAKNSGYDIYYQRYDSACTPLGGSDEVQAIQFIGNPSAGSTFRIEFEGVTTDKITIGANTTATARNIKAALSAIGLDVDVEASSSGMVYVQFLGKWGSKNISSMSVPLSSIELKDAKTGQTITSSTVTNGASGEARANDTTTGDQRYSSVAIAQDGEIIISWTSWGQGQDREYETNIYAKNFPANASVVTRHNRVSLAERVATIESVDRDILKIVSADSPSNHVAMPAEYSGVVLIEAIDDNGVTIWSGSGSLLVSGVHILTAAHVVFDEAGAPLPAENIRVTFLLPNDTRVSYAVSQNTVHYSYAGDPTRETDLAILTLAAMAPGEVERYDIYRGGGEIGSVQTTVGYGTIGTGYTGNQNPDGSYRFDPENDKRFGQNKYEANASILGPEYNPNTLLYDFDSGSRLYDTLGVHFGYNDLGLGASLEATSAQGDSGGPAFIAGKIAGVVSYGGAHAFGLGSTDYNDIDDCSFGEISVDVRVSAYADWIDSIVSTGTLEYLVNQTEQGDQIWSDVAISMTGEVVFTWTSFNQDGIGAGPGGMSEGLAGVYARRFTMEGTPVSAIIGGDVTVDDEGNTVVTNGIQVGDEFLVNDYLADDQYYSSVSISHAGDFMITWESFRDIHQITTQLPDSGYGLGGTITESIVDFGIYAKRYTSLSTLLASRDNTSTSQYGLPSNTRYVAGYGHIGIHGEIGSEFRINKEHYVGDQTGATVTLNANGDAIIVFQGNTGEEGAETKVYYRAVPLNADNTGPIVTGTTLFVKEPILDDDGNQKYDGDGNPLVGDQMLFPIQNGAIVYGEVTQMLITFSEEMYRASMHDEKSIIDPQNWHLQLRGGSTTNITIVDVQFGKNLLYNSLGGTNSDLRLDNWEAIITFDSNIALPGNQALATGSYTLIIDDTVTDLDDNNLDGDYNGLSGGNFLRDFQVIAPAKVTDDEEDDEDDPTDPGVDEKAFNRTEFGNNIPAVASANDGSFVVVAVHYGTIGSPDEPMLSDYTFDDATGVQTSFPGNIIMQRYDKNGVKIGTTRIVNDYMIGNQTDPEIAMDNDGNMAVVWSGYGPVSNNSVYCKIYDQNGVAVVDQFKVNANNLVTCLEPNVAYDENGNIIVTWLEHNPITNTSALMARIYNSRGVLQSTSFDNVTASNNQMTLVEVVSNNIDTQLNPYRYDIAVDDNGHLIVTWLSNSTLDIYAKVLTYTSTTGQLTTSVPAFRVNQYTSNTQIRPSVAVAENGTFVVTWASERQDGDGYGIYARRFNVNGNGNALSILGTTGDALINVYTVGLQYYPDVSMAPNGDFVITWTSYNQEPDNFYDDDGTGTTQRRPATDNAVFARAFSGTTNNANVEGYDLKASYIPNRSSAEFRLNSTLLGHQQYSVVTMCNDGISFAWVGPVNSEIILEENTDGTYTSLMFPTTDVFTRTYRDKIDTGSVLGGYANKKVSTYSAVQQTSGGGYAGQKVSGYKADNTDSTTLFLDGTAGDDVFEVIIEESGAVQVKVNGVLKSVSANISDIRLSGQGGNDKITVTTSQDGNSAVLNAGDQRLSLTTADGRVFSAYQFEDIELNVAGSNNAINVLAAGNDQLTIRSQKLDLSGDGYYYVANGFSLVSALSSSYTSKALLYDTLGDDSLVMSHGKAVMKGQGYEHTVSGFGNVSAYASRGKDTVVMEGSGKDDSAYVSANIVSIKAGGIVNTAKGFNQVYVVGNGGKDTVNIVGSYLADRFTGTLNYAEMNFGTGSYVGLYGFSNFNVAGGGGYDVVSLTDVAQNTTARTSGNTGVFDSVLQSYRISDFNEVRLIREATNAVDATTVAATSQSAASLPLEDDALLNLIAAGHSNSQKSDSDDIVDELDIDYLLKIGAL